MHGVKLLLIDHSLVGSVVIGVKLGKEEHDSIPRNCNRKGLEPILDLTGGEKLNKK
jgi:hypothetical protein